MLLQAQPHIFEREEDISTVLTETLRETSTSDLKDRIHCQGKALNRSLEVHNPATGVDEAPPPMLCVLDEVQNTLSLCLDAWASLSRRTRQPNVLFCEKYGFCGVRCPGVRVRIALSGTGVELRALEDTLTSTACRAVPVCACARHRRLRG